jgi:hypothetical protein
MLTGLKKFLAISGAFAVIGISLHIVTHDFHAHSQDNCVLCIAASSVLPVNAVTVQPADPTILFTAVPVADVPVKSVFYNTVLSRGPPVL